MHHVHADDVARAFGLALDSWGVAVGESFHVVSPAALTLRGYVEAVAWWFGVPARLRFVPWEEWREDVSEKEAEGTGTTSPTVPTAASLKPSACLATSLATARCRP